jgi:hypothetical protein
MLYMYGISKLLHLQFNMQSQLAQQAVGSLSGYQLTWFYFGFSRVYATILGLTQVAGATLLLFRKTTLLGTLAMLPVMANILLINMFILVNDYGPYLISGLICASLLIILWQQRAALFSRLWSTQNGEAVRRELVTEKAIPGVEIGVSTNGIAASLLPPSIPPVGTRRTWSRPPMRGGSVNLTIGRSAAREAAFWVDLEWNRR